MEGRNNNNKRQYLLYTTLICLIGLVALQVNGIFRSAHMQEVQFKHSVDLALQNFSEKIKKDKDMYTIIKRCAHSDKTFEHVNKSYLNQLSRKELAEVESTIQSDLALFGIDLDFDFDIVNRSKKNKDGNLKNILGDAYFLHDIYPKSGLSLKVQFPRKRAFLAAQVGPEFISAILLIIFTSVSFTLIYRFYKKEQKLSANMKDFINNMTHELKTPLSSITFSNKMIMKNPDIGDAKLEKYTSIIAEESEKLNQQVEEILNVAKLGEHDYESEYETLTPNLLVENANENLKVLIEEKKASVTLKLCPNCGTIIGHKIHLTNTIGNIIENALKYSKRTPLILIESFVKSDMYILRIVDNGIGIAKDNINYIFDKFYRVATNDRHDVKGYGLGLSYVKEVITNHNGQVMVESEQGEGSTFTISLPLTTK